jgi:hypothetical protein
MDSEKICDFIEIVLSIIIYPFWIIYYVSKYHLRCFKSIYYRDISYAVYRAFPTESITYYKLNQVMDVCDEVKADEIKCGKGFLDLKYLYIFKNDTHMGLVSICKCCNEIGFSPS